MNPNSSPDNFIFSFPTGFVPKDLEDKWLIHLKNYRKPFTSVLDYINSNIQEVLLPGINVPTVVQKQMYGKEMNFRGSKSPYDITSREFSINLKNTDFNIFYFILEDILYYHYIKNNVPFIVDFTIIVLDNYRREILKIVLKQILLTGLSDIKFAYQDKSVEEIPITLSFLYNYKDIEYIPRWDNGSITGELIDDYSNTILRNDDSVPKTPPSDTKDSDDDFIIGQI